MPLQIKDCLQSVKALTCYFAEANALLDSFSQALLAAASSGFSSVVNLDEMRCPRFVDKFRLTLSKVSFWHIAMQIAGSVLFVMLTIKGLCLLNRCLAILERGARKEPLCRRAFLLFLVTTCSYLLCFLFGIHAVSFMHLLIVTLVLDLLRGLR
ncbi:hypothetical protein [Candidatus Similichlamydia laticola]|uniref:Uncharacterized protein n=1 Tax=Candidatus Similichlamydia laticola TaxID=2170265 RepID=A0A369KCZ3_9BACT|nr:hypothetical protein [Candidatus Similichlamydia laticola]RDB31768.1 hypothetical protein HAT2_00148 [Candidatus Similichlamydia laticola]